MVGDHRFLVRAYNQHADSACGGVNVIRVGVVQSLVDAYAHPGARCADAGAQQAEIDTGQTRSLPLATPLPVYALYITASGAHGAVL